MPHVKDVRWIEIDFNGEPYRAVFDKPVSVYAAMTMARSRAEKGEPSAPPYDRVALFLEKWTGRLFGWLI